MKDWAKKGLLATGGLRLAADWHDSSAAILMYHSVLPDPSQLADSLGGIVHSEAAFSGQIELLARDYHPISLNDAVKHLRNGEDFPKRSVVITFDDGYADNYEYAIPILDRAGVPAVFYVTVDCVENRRLPWPSRLRFAFRTTHVESWSQRQTPESSARSWSLSDPLLREQAFLAASDTCCRLSGAAQSEFVNRVEHELEAGLPTHFGSLMMTYDQVRSLAGRGHVAGSHTMTHPNMAYLKSEDAHRELAESKQRLELQLNSPVMHFSYPCPAMSPHWNERTVEQSRALGYVTGVTTNSGLTRKADNLLCLKRLHPTKTVDGLRWNLESAFAGRRV
jgi:peptidoglycan/xylan/chitin deacetylase (PgdA/CDA1 family)